MFSTELWLHVSEYLTEEDLIQLTQVTKGVCKDVKADIIWKRRVVGRIQSKFSPAPGSSSWFSVYLVGKQEAKHQMLGYPMFKQPLEVIKNNKYEFKILVETKEKKYMVSTDGEQSLEIFGTIKQYRKRGLTRRHVLKTIYLCLLKQEIILSKDQTQRIHHFHCPIQEIVQVQLSQEQTHAFVIQTSEVSLELICNTIEIANVWVTSIRHNMKAHRMKNASIPEAISLKRLGAKSLTEGKLERQAMESSPLHRVNCSSSSTHVLKVSRRSLLLLSKKKLPVHALEVSNAGEEFVYCKVCGSKKPQAMSFPDLVCVWFCSRECKVFFDDIHTNTRATQRTALLQHPSAPEFVTAIIHDALTFEGRVYQLLTTRALRTRPKTQVQYREEILRVGDFISNLTEYVLRYRQEELSKCGQSLDEIQSGVRKAIERAVFHVLGSRIAEWISKCIDCRDLIFYASRCSLWSKLEPSDPVFDIPAEYQSKSRWLKVRLKLKAIEKCVAPTEKLEVLSRAIAEVFNEEDYLNSHVLVSADQLLPILIYVLCQLHLEDPLALVELLWNFGDKQFLHGETAYYLTMFEAAAAYIQITDGENAKEQL